MARSRKVSVSVSTSHLRPAAVNSRRWTNLASYVSGSEVNFVHCMPVFILSQTIPRSRQAFSWRSWLFVWPGHTKPRWKNYMYGFPEERLKPSTDKNSIPILFLFSPFFRNTHSLQKTTWVRNTNDLSCLNYNVLHAQFLIFIYFTRWPSGPISDYMYCCKPW